MKTLADRVRERRKELKLSQLELGKRIGVGQSTIGNIESGRNKSATFLPQLANALGVSAIWLAEGKGEMLPRSNDEPTSIDSDTRKKIALANALERGDITLEDYAKESNTSALPFYNISADKTNNQPTLNATGQRYFTHNEEFAELGLSPDRAFWCHAIDDSMAPTISRGDRLLIENLIGQSLSNIINDKIYLFTWRGEVQCKRLVKQFDGKLLVKSDNSDSHTSALLSPDDIATLILIGRVRVAYSQNTL